MLEIWLLWVLTKRIGKIVEQKDRKSGWYKILTVLLWLGGEFTGVIVGIAIVDKFELSEWVAYLFGWVGAAVGAGIAYLIANKLPSVKIVSPTILGCAIASFLLASACALVVALLVYTPEICSIRVSETETFIIYKGTGAMDVCEYALTTSPEVFTRTFSPPRSPVICKDIIGGIEYTIIDTEPTGVGGSLACRHLNEQ